MPADARPDPRVVALSRASERLLKRTGSWAHIPPARLSAYERMRIWHESIPPSSSAVLVFDAADVGEPNLGYIAENRALQVALLAAFAEAGGHLEPEPLTALSIGEEHVQVSTPRGTLTARLVVGADGAQSAVRAAAALSIETRAYERWRKSELAGMALAIDAFDRLLAHGAGPVARLAQRGLSWVNRSQELRRFFIYRALGMSGELPEAAR